MRLDEVLGMAGDHPLSEFHWGEDAVELYNSLVAPEHAIDIHHTGKEAFDKLRRLPSSILMKILVRNVDIDGDNVEFVGGVADEICQVPPTVPQVNQRRMSPIAVFLMIIMSVISFALVIGAQRYPESATSNFDALKTVIGAMVEVVKDDQPARQAPSDSTGPSVPQ